MLKRRHPDSPSQDVDDDGLAVSTSSSSKERRLSPSALGASDRCTIPAPSGQPKILQGLTGVLALDQASFEAHHVRELVDCFASMGGVSHINSSQANNDDATGNLHHCFDEKGFWLTVLWLNICLQ